MKINSYQRHLGPCALATMCRCAPKTFFLLFWYSQSSLPPSQTPTQSLAIACAYSLYTVCLCNYISQLYLASLATERGGRAATCILLYCTHTPHNPLLTCGWLLGYRCYCFAPVNFLLLQIFMQCRVRVLSLIRQFSQRVGRMVNKAGCINMGESIRETRDAVVDSLLCLLLFVPGHSITRQQS